MESIHFISVGEFGTGLMNHIRNKFPSISTSMLVEEDFDHFFNTLSVAKIYTLATATYTSKIYRQLDYQVYRKRACWIPIVYDHPFLRVGPVLTPHIGIDYSCFEEQLQSNSALSNYRNNVYDYNDQFPFSGPKGYLPPFIGWAGAIFSYVLHEFGEIERRESRFYYQLNVTNQYISREVLHPK
ncbi:hypothetical protein [Sediminibacillus sp. JSM 1682029]|uniref:hypothetical protein n=1 Tax=Sediminibacillus sp. JSM 1682029 TaxID=3229857 RepID=UPI003525610D